jgi:hypothetical protein
VSTTNEGGEDDPLGDSDFGQDSDFGHESSPERSIANIIARVIDQKRVHSREGSITALEMARWEYERGSNRTIMFGVYCCAKDGLSLPPWLANAFTQMYRDVKAFKFPTWEAALGPAHDAGAKTGKRGAGAKQRARRRSLELEIPVWVKVREGLSLKKKPLDNDVFEWVSNELKLAVDAATVKRIYYDSDRDGLERTVYIAKLLKQLAGDAEARAFIEDHFIAHPFKTVAIDLISQEVRK